MLPKNAHEPLKKGEKYTPFVADSKRHKQISAYSVILGFFAVILFTGASAFLGVKIAQVPEASMTVALLAMALSRIIGRQNAILENVIIQSIASVATGVGAGAIFVLPAIYILQLEMATFLQMFLACGIGSVLAVILTTLLRNYYVAKQHGVYPYPEATVAAETLAAGDQEEGSGMKLIGVGLIFGAVIDFCNYYLGLWKCVFSTSFLPFFDKLASNAKLVVNYDVSAAVIGMGYIMGLRFALIICISSLSSDISCSCLLLPISTIFFFHLFHRPYWPKVISPQCSPMTFLRSM